MADTEEGDPVVVYGSPYALGRLHDTTRFDGSGNCPK